MTNSYRFRDGTSSIPSALLVDPDDPEQGELGRMQDCKISSRNREQVKQLAELRSW
jgi:hypothetical protein